LDNGEPSALVLKHLHARHINARRLKLAQQKRAVRSHAAGKRYVQAPRRGARERYRLVKPLAAGATNHAGRRQRLAARNHMRHAIRVVDVCRSKAQDAHDASRALRPAQSMVAWMGFLFGIIARAGTPRAAFARQRSAARGLERRLLSQAGR